ncbi:hypothetical protein NQP46_20850 [Streptomyces albus]|nr:hypothetical protein NQP46_20850 [Streptomyces albus]
MLWHHARTRPLTAHHAAWTASGWTASALDEMPGCRTAAAILTRRRLLLHPRGRAPLTVTTEPHREQGRSRHADPTAVVSAVHAWLAAGPPPGARQALLCDTGRVTVRVHLAPAEERDLDYEV